MEKIIVPVIKSGYTTSQTTRNNNQILKENFIQNIEKFLDSKLHPQWREFIKFCWTEKRFSLDISSLGSKDRFYSVTMDNEFNPSEKHILSMNNYIQTEIDKINNNKIHQDLYKSLIEKYKSIFEKYAFDTLFIFINYKNQIQINYSEYYSGRDNSFKKYDEEVKVIIDENFNIGEPIFKEFKINSIKLAKEFIEAKEPLRLKLLLVAEKLVKEIKEIN